MYKRSFNIRFCFLLLTFFLLSQYIKASSYWMEIHGSGKLNAPVKIQVCYGFIDDLGLRHRTTGDEFQEIKNFRFFIINTQGEQSNIEVKINKDCWEATFTPNKEGSYRILGENDTQPVLVRSKNTAENIRPIDFICGTYHVGDPADHLMPAQFMDIILQEKEGIYTILPYRDMKPVDKGTGLRIFNPENWERNVFVDEKHRAVFRPTVPGLYVIRQDWYDNTPGTFRGNAYGKIRYRNNYCLWLN